ncbi:hypothetical protein B0H11DRAFT_1961496 [Mycena galericulata]|nr:hypothetical protein B0H11DRAFT_1961496 [Mycena galericulata]
MASDTPPIFETTGTHSERMLSSIEDSALRELLALIDTWKSSGEVKIEDSAKAIILADQIRMDIGGKSAAPVAPCEEDSPRLPLPSTTQDMPITHTHHEKRTEDLLELPMDIRVPRPPSQAPIPETMLDAEPKRRGVPRLRFHPQRGFSAQICAQKRSRHGRRYLAEEVVHYACSRANLGFARDRPIHCRRCYVKGSDENVRRHCVGGFAGWNAHATEGDHRAAEKDAIHRQGASVVCSRIMLGLSTPYGHIPTPRRL